MIVETKIEELYGGLPDAPSPVASYITVKQTGNLVYLAGQGPIINGVKMFEGKLGELYGVDEGYEAARLCGMNLLAQLKKQVGDLDRVKSIVNAKIYVASADDFTEQPKVANGLSDLLVAVFGEKGKHTRCALGLNVLPDNIPVEAEMIVETED